MRLVLVFLGLAAAVLAALVAQWPAGHGAGMLIAGSGLVLSDFDGTVWSGRASRGGYRGLEFGSVRWELDARALWRLALRADVVVDGPGVAAHGSIERARGGAVELRDVEARLPAAWLQRILNEPLLGLGGDLGLTIRHARLDAGGRLAALDGSARWDPARLTGRIAAELGALVVHWRTESPGVILGSLADAGGPLELDGVVTITADHYDIDARLRARGDVIALRQALDLLGRPDAAGWLRLRIGGPMLPLSRHAPAATSRWRALARARAAGVLDPGATARPGRLFRLRRKPQPAPRGQG